MAQSTVNPKAAEKISAYINKVDGEFHLIFSQ